MMIAGYFYYGGFGIHLGRGFHILFSIGVMVAILALFRWLMLCSTEENYYPDMKDMGKNDN